tara:strand:+ start:2730 stop:3845 length:1116 start_codon:yes stop_codon:yes gene_type:complete
MDNQKRTFGVEIEFIATADRETRCDYCGEPPDENDDCHEDCGRQDWSSRQSECDDEIRSRIARTLREKTGLEVHHQSWNTRTQDYWKLIYDGSVNGSEGANCELISPPLKGDEGLLEVGIMSEALNSIPRIKIDKSCGLHVHHDAREISAKAMGKLVQFYSTYEGIIDSFMPMSRRSNKASYCASLKNFLGFQNNKDLVHSYAMKMTEMIEQRRIEDGPIYNKRVPWPQKDTGRGIEKRMKKRNKMNSIWDSSERYCKINLASFWKHGTLEFRHHSGTVEHEKILNWIELTSGMVDFVCDGRTMKGFSFNALYGDGSTFNDFNHKPTFGKLLHACNASDSVAQFYKERREKFRTEYGTYVKGCTHPERSYE